MADLAEKAQAIKKAEAALAAFIRRHEDRNEPQFDIETMKRGVLIDATGAGKVVFEIELGLEYSNSLGFLAGAAAALIFDLFTSITFAPLLPIYVPGEWNSGPPGGVTQSLNLSYLRPLKLPAKVRVECEVVEHGKLVSLAKGVILSLDGKKIYSLCEHHKVEIAMGRPSTRGTSKM